MGSGRTVENEAPIANNAWKHQSPGVVHAVSPGETAGWCRRVRCKMAEQNEGNATRYLPFNSTISSYHTLI